MILAMIWLISISLVLSPVVNLGRCPVDSVVEISASNFISRDSFQVLVKEKVGVWRCSFAETGTAVLPVPIYRLALLNQTSRGFQVCWQSGLFSGKAGLKMNLVPGAWAVGDFDNDSLAEVLQFEAGCVKLLNFDFGEVRQDSFFYQNGVVFDAVGTDIDRNGVVEVFTLEQVRDSTGSKQAVRVWELSDTGLICRGKPVFLPESLGLSFSFAGSARLEDYPGEVVIVVGEYGILKPSRYYAVYAGSPDSFVLTGIPFPWEEWFSKEQVLAAGRLNPFNVGDTLVAYGYFVPGSGVGSGLNFAALQDGEWRVLRPQVSLAGFSGLWCRVGENWLNLRQGVFYLYTEVPFLWR